MVDATISNMPGLSIRGPEQAEAVVLLHGALANRHIWEQVVDHLEDKFRCISVDLPGQGELTGEEFTVDSAIERLDDVLAALKGGSIVLVGLSSGGYIAQNYAARNPEHVSGLVLSGATMPFTGWNGLVLRLTGIFIRLFPQWTISRFIEILRTDVGPEIADAVVRGRLSAQGGSQAFRRLPGTDYTRELVGYTGPILIVNGENDDPNRKAEKRFQSLLPQAESVAIPNGGHGAAIEQPKAFAEAIRRLMALVTRR